MYNGVVNVYKEQDYTSFDVVAKLRGVFGQKKIGHTGTLDPMAEGVLPIVLGCATKLSELITSEDKEYDGVLRLGIKTDTDDITGKIIAEGRPFAPEQDIRGVFQGFQGKLMQIPPIYSAIKKDGKKLYEYARQGQEIELDPRPVEIFKLDIEKIEMPDVYFHVKCSKGTYIRSLCRDIGDELGCYGTLAALRRTETCGFKMEDGLKISDLQRLKEEGRLDSAVLPIDSLLSDIPKAEIRSGAEKLLVNGNKLSEDMLISDETVDALHAAPYIRIYRDKELSALYKYNSDSDCYKCFKYLQ
jgi:tRNA pseudouridine55 synthase